MGGKAAKSARLSALVQEKQAQDRRLAGGKFHEALTKRPGVFPEGGLPRPAYRQDGGRVWVFE